MRSTVFGIVLKIIRERPTRFLYQAPMAFQRFRSFLHVVLLAIVVLASSVAFAKKRMIAISSQIGDGLMEINVTTGQMTSISALPFEAKAQGKRLIWLVAPSHRGLETLDDDILYDMF